MDAKRKRVLVIGLEPSLVDFSAMPDMNADKVRTGLATDQATLNGLGYDAHLCLTDLGETAGQVVTEVLSGEPFDCIAIGAGIRTLPAYFLLFERLINIVHAHAPAAKICFNTKPSDTAEAVRRWV
ncbi:MULTISPECIES: hypothetical protein [unclassified Variovorax]|uniref:hypothetical protein n=1 Tax=unclassified Variovorax TaxID=663243 RepID=UPI001BD2DF88|nr:MULTISPECIES: hypothetical protein [unclassified Variovorax]